MLSFRVEYAIRILEEMHNRKRAGVLGVPLTWLKRICGNDANGLSIVMRMLCKMGWVNYDRQTYLYSLNVNTGDLSLYDLCQQVNEGSSALPDALRNDGTEKKLRNIFQSIKLSQFINADVVV